MPNTSLTWEVYKTKAAKLKSQGLNFPQIYNKLGNPIWEGQQWRLEMDKGNIKRKRQSARQANRTKYNNLRKLRDVTKTEAEGRSFRQTQREAAADSDNLIHQIAYEGKPSIAEHDVALQAGGSKEHHSKSDPDFKEFKDINSGEDTNDDLNYSFLSRTFSSLSRSQKDKILQILNNTSKFEKAV